RPLQGRRSRRGEGLRGARADPAGGGRRLHHVRADAPAARERGRDRGQGARPVERREDRARMTDRPLRVAILSPVWFPVPPTGYGGIEWIVSLLADGLADAGHDVTLFASGDSRT